MTAEAGRAEVSPALQRLREIHAGRLSSGAAQLLAGAESPAIGPHPAPSPPRASLSAAASLDDRVGINLLIQPDPAALGTQRAQAEPHLARSPLNPDVLLATWQDGRFSSGGGALACGYGLSTNGGLSWTRGLIPQLTRASGGSLPRATDPVAAFLPNGHLLLNTLGIAGEALETGVLLLSVSTNQGGHFDPPIEIYRSPNASVFPDKNWIAVNHFAATPHFGRIAVTFTRFDTAAAPICVVVSDDAGRTWNQPAFVTTAASLCQGSQPVFLPDGSLAVVYWRFANPTFNQPHQLEVALSADGGLTFDAPRVIAPVPFTHNDVLARDGYFLPSAAGDTHGNLFVAWQALVDGWPKILFARSPDRGVTWTAPVAVNDTPEARSAFNATLAVSPDGRTVSVAYWDKRHASGSGTLVDTYLAQSFDGGTNWLPSLRLTDRSTDLLLAPTSGTERMIGDYFGLLASPQPDVPAIVLTIDTRSGNPDPLVIRVGQAPALSFANWRAARWSLADIQNPIIAGADADPDADGLSLFGEYAFGRDPFTADAANLNLVALGETIRLTHPQRPLAGDVRFLWESVGAQNSWRPAEVTPVVEASSPTAAVVDATATEPTQLFRVRAEPKP